MARHLDLEGVHNCRDFGGYAAGAGRSLRRGRLYRSAHHHNATDADLERLRALGLSVVVDLRQPSERAREPSRRWADFACQVVENDQTEQHLGFEAVLRLADLSPGWFREHHLAFYRRAPYEPRHVDLFRRYFQALADAEGAILVHCAAGKDRTGLICALTHHAAGVHRDDLLADYLLTNDEARIAAKIQGLGGYVERAVGRRPSDEALRVAASVRPEYLERAFAAIAERDGSLERYLDHTLGLGADVRERLQDRLLA